MPRLLCLYLPRWPIQRLLAARKEEVFGTKEKNQLALRSPPFAPGPLLLHARDPRRGEIIVACDTAAMERGVRINMPLAEAEALAQHDGPCLVLPHDPAADLAALARLAEHCERFSPIVGWQTVADSSCKVQSSKLHQQPSALNLQQAALSCCGPNNLFLDVTAIGILFGGEENLAREAIADLAHHGYEARAAIAHSLGAAWAAAQQSSSPRIQVLAASGRPPASDQTPASATAPSPLPPPGSSPGALPLESLRLLPETIHLLNQLGIERLEQLLVLPRESLRARFGERLLLRIDQWLGTAQEMIVPYRPPPQFIREWLPEFPVERREAVEQMVCHLISRVAHDLAERREGVLKLCCRLDCAPGRPLFLEVSLFRPSAQAEHLCDLARMQLEQAPLSGPVGRARVEATCTAPLENRQAELFAGSEHEAARHWALFIDRCSSRLGKEAVLRPQLTADPLPERAVKYKAAVRGRESGARRARDARRQPPHSPLSAPRSPLLRPLLLRSPPQPLEVLSVAPDGPPVSFRFQGRSYHIAHQSGPERIETGWWRGQSVRRDYWRVETTTGQRFWLFRQLGGGLWFFHGEFA